jgi:nucleoside-diphosphate-sugar epimerase
MRIFLTGSSACLSRPLLPALCAEAGVEAVTGIDLKPAWFSHPKFTAVQLDLRDTRVPALLAGHDALVHLAFVVLRGRMSEAEMFDINVRAAHRLFHDARAAGIKRLVQMSSASVYGSGIHLDENKPCAPPPDFLYAQHKAHLEQLLALEFPECVRLRPHVILGPNAQPLLRQFMRQPFYVKMPEPYPLLQCVHEADVVRAVILALNKDVRGPYNLAVDDVFSFRDVVKARHRFAVPLPRFATRAAYGLAWRLSGWGGEPAWIDALQRTLLLNCRRAITDLDWRSRYTASDVLAAA